MQSLPAISNLLKLKPSAGLPRRFQDNLMIFLFLLPAVVLFLLFVVYPILQSVYYSLFNWKGFGPAVDFVGLDNFKNILKDRVFLIALRNGLLIIALSLLVQLPLSLLLAVLVGRDLPGRVFFRTVFFLPYVLSEVIAALMWLFILNPDPDRGFVNAVIVALGGQPQAWLGNPNLVLIAIFAALTWKYFGYHMLLFMTGLQNIPSEIEEAGRVDGANALQNFFYITLPLLSSTIRTSVYISVLGSLQQFIMVWIMSKGGPVNASETMATYMYRFGFVRFQLGYGSAVAIYMFLLCLIFSLIYLHFTRKPDYLSGLEG
ncbi:MAG: sugar ABC transporter permease [Anaerolineales bacterium]|nr:sugar ABC transporter permease [Anaerolineales bacterium]MCX7755267.1 sugar ABC transporter permease [Anaerolineales bacterium]MDW8278931.1 sugar ABC transporter permease [Anaerolineales bacterium]